MKKLKTQKGITLVALIITIVVLLILAVVAIGAVSDSNIIAHAQNAATNYNNAKNKENELLSGYLSEIETYLPGGSKNTGGEGILTDGPVSNTYGEDWTYAYVYNGTSWEGPKTKANGDTAEGQIVAKFYKQTYQVDPETIYYQTLSVDPINDYAYKLAIEGTGNMGNLANLGTVPTGYAWQESYLDAIMGMPYELLLTPYVTEIMICDGITDIGSRAFMGSVSLKNVVVANTVETIGEQAFYGCNKLSAIALPENLKTIGYAAFDKCISLTEVIIPKGVTELGSSAFRECANLKDVIILSDNIWIYTEVFSECTNLRKLKIYATTLNCDASIGIAEMPEDGKVYVLDEAFVSEVSGVSSGDTIKATIQVVTKEQMDAL